MPVYLIRQGLTGPVKIGVANDVVKRLRQLQTNQPIALRILRVLDGDRVLEGALHSRFSSARLKGEWFTYADEMADGYLGAADLPIPLIKRYCGRSRPDNAWGNERCLHEEILSIIGGADALGRRMRQAPWVVVQGGLIFQSYWSATVLMLIEAGRSTITFDMLWDARAAVAEEAKKIAEHNARIERERQKTYDDRREIEWIRKHGADAAWWTLSTEIDASKDVA